MSSFRQSMNSCAISLRRFSDDEHGASAVEYGLLASLIAAAIITVLGTLGGKLKTTFTNVANGMK